MSLLPLASHAKYHISASSAAGLLAVSVLRVAASIAQRRRALPECRALQCCGKQADCGEFEVRPPTQSHIGSRVSQPSDPATPSSLEPAPVMAIACGEIEACGLVGGLASSMPLRVSGVPPDLEMTTARFHRVDLRVR